MRLLFSNSSKTGGRFRMAAQILWVFLVAAFVFSSPCIAQEAKTATNLGTLLGKLGFKPMISAEAFSCQGQGIIPAAVSPSRDLPTIIYLFQTTQASARATLTSFENLRVAFKDRVGIFAITPATVQAASSMIKGLKLNYMILAAVRTTPAIPVGSSPQFLVLAPGGEILGMKTGSLEWNGANARALVEELAKDYPAGSAASDKAAQSPSPQLIPPPVPSPQPTAPVALPPPPPAQPIPTSPQPDPALASAQPASAVQTLAAASFLSALEAEVVKELSLARTSPAEYVKALREYRSMIHGDVFEEPGEIGIMLDEGTAAVDEAIAFLEKQKPLSPLTASLGLSRAASDLVLDQGPKGGTGHTGSDGSDPFDRMDRYGSWQKTAGENCAYGPDKARMIVIQLIVDDGVSSRGHRANIFNPDFKVVGVSVGPHKVFGTVCVQDFAGGFKDK